jgi:DNA modification methylase
LGYRIQFFDDSSFRGDNPYGFYLGKVHYQTGLKNEVNYPSCTGDESHPKIKIYKTYQNALKTAERVLKDCYYVESFEITEG